MTAPQAGRQPPSVWLDRPRPGDARAMVAAMCDPAVAGWLSAVPQPYGPAEAAEYIAKAGLDDHVIRIGQDLVGGIRAGRDLGIWVAPAWQGQGVARRAAILGLGRAFAGGVDMVTAAHYLDNDRSARFLAGLGFADPVADSIPMRAWGGATRPVLRLRLTRDRFAARHPFAFATARLAVRPAASADLPELTRIVTRPDVARMLLLFRPDQPLTEIAAHFPPAPAGPPLRLAAWLGDRLVGSIGIGQASGDMPAPVFYFLDPAVAGQGLASEMLAGLLAEADARLGPAPYSADVFADNPASRRVLEKAGFRVVADLPALLSVARNGPAPGWRLLREAPAIA